MRRSLAKQKNTMFGDLGDWARRRGNSRVFENILTDMHEKYDVGNRGMMVIGLVGSTDHFSVTVRRAQATLRWDRMPSLWSHSFLIAEPWDGTSNVDHLPILEVPLFPRSERFHHPESNGLITTARLGDYSDAELDANIALLAVVRRAPSDGRGVAPLEPLTEADVKTLQDRATQPNFDRQRFSFWDWMCRWQTYLWSEGEMRNPLREGIPLPSSSYVEMVYGALGCDLAPGASERNSAPEHLWNAAMWWHQDSPEFAQQDVNPYVMCGAFALRDKGATIRSESR